MRLFKLLIISALVGSHGSTLGLASSIHSSSAAAAGVVPPSSLVHHVFIGGLGYCGSRIAQAIRREFPDCRITGTVRSQQRRNDLLLLQKDKSFGDDAPPWNDVFVLDLDEDYVGLDEVGQEALRQATHVIQTVAPIADFDKDPLLALHGDILLHAVGDESPPHHLSWVGYLSSTGVYGNHDGAWVDEKNSELLCTDAKSLARITAEADWKTLEAASLANGKTTRIDCFRCGGIYGPGRGPLFAAANKQGNMADAASPISETPKYVNRILVDDICGALIAAMKSDRPLKNGRVYNLVDDDPAPRREVVLEARKIRGVLDDDNERTATSRQRASGRNTGNKRCRNDRLKADYGWTLVAPTFREGLAQLYYELES